MGYVRNALAHHWEAELDTFSGPRSQLERDSTERCQAFNQDLRTSTSFMRTSCLFCPIPSCFLDMMGFLMSSSLLFASVRVVFPAGLALIMISPCATIFISTGIDAFLINCTGYAIHPALSGRERIVAYIPLAVGFSPPRVPSRVPLVVSIPLSNLLALSIIVSCLFALAPLQKPVLCVYW